MPAGPVQINSACARDDQRETSKKIGLTPKCQKKFLQIEKRIHRHFRYFIIENMPVEKIRIYVGLELHADKFY